MGNIRTNGLGWAIKPISYVRHRFPAELIGHAAWLYFRFTLSYRHVEDRLAERGIEVGNESSVDCIEIRTRDCAKLA
jgi:transposase-like protein